METEPSPLARKSPKRPTCQTHRYFDCKLGFFSERARLRPYSAVQFLVFVSPPVNPKSKPVVMRKPKKKHYKKLKAVESEPKLRRVHRKKGRGVVDPQYWEDCATFEFEHRAMRRLFEKTMKEKDEEIEEMRRKSDECNRGSEQENNTLKREMEVLKQRLEGAEQETKHREKVYKAEIDTFQQENDQFNRKITHMAAELQTANEEITRFLCPSEREHLSADRDPSELVKSLWNFTLMENPTGIDTNFKSKILQSVTISNQITHKTIKSGLDRLNFPITHSESLKLALLICPNCEPETVSISLDDFSTMLSTSQPYQLWEDLSDTLIAYRVKLAYSNVTENDVKSSFEQRPGELTKAEISDLLLKNWFDPEQQPDYFADFLLQGQQSAPNSLIVPRLFSALSHWQPFSSIKSRNYLLLSQMVESDPSLVARLRSLMSVNNLVPVADFTAVLRMHNHTVDAEFDLYVRCFNYPLCGAAAVNIHEMLHSVYVQSLTPHQLSAVRPDLRESDWSEEEG